MCRNIVHVFPVTWKRVPCDSSVFVLNTLKSYSRIGRGFSFFLLPLLSPAQEKRTVRHTVGINQQSPHVFVVTWVVNKMGIGFHGRRSRIVYLYILVTYFREMRSKEERWVEIINE